MLKFADNIVIELYILFEETLDDLFAGLTGFDVFFGDSLSYPLGFDLFQKLQSPFEKAWV